MRRESRGSTGAAPRRGVCVAPDRASTTRRGTPRTRRCVRRAPGGGALDEALSGRSRGGPAATFGRREVSAPSPLPEDSARLASASHGPAGSETGSASPSTADPRCPAASGGTFGRLPWGGAPVAFLCLWTPGRRGASTPGEHLLSLPPQARPRPHRRRTDICGLWQSRGRPARRAPCSLHVPGGLRLNRSQGAARRLHGAHVRRRALCVRKCRPRVRIMTAPCRASAPQT